MSGEQSKRLDALLESVTNSVNKMEVYVPPVPSYGTDGSIILPMVPRFPRLPLEHTYSE
jgi:hypothetical protein